jgi:hypothetical protein
MLRYPYFLPAGPSSSPCPASQRPRKSAFFLWPFTPSVSSPFVPFCRASISYGEAASIWKPLYVILFRNNIHDKGSVGFLYLTIKPWVRSCASIPYKLKRFSLSSKCRIILRFQLSRPRFLIVLQISYLSRYLLIRCLGVSIHPICITGVPSAMYGMQEQDTTNQITEAKTSYT